MAGRLKIWNAGTSTWEYTSADFSNNMLQVNNETPGGLINGSNTAFTTASDYASGTLKVFKNGIRLKAGGADYTETTSGFTMVTAPATGTVLLVDYLVNTSIYSQGLNNYMPPEVPTGLVNGSNKVYTTSTSYIGGTLQVYINGILQAPSTHFTETTPSSGTFTMSDAPLTGDNILVSYQHNLASTGDADTVDGIHANATATANTLLPLDANGKYIKSTIYGSGNIIETLVNNTQFSTASTSYVDMTNATITITTSAVTTGKIKLMATCGYIDNSGDNLTYLALTDSANTVLTSAVRKRATTNNGDGAMSLQRVISNLSANTEYTYKLRCKVSAGTGYWNSTVLTNGVVIIAEEVL